MKKLFEAWCGISLVKRIVAGLIIGAVLGLALPQFSAIAILGSVFVGALKAVAPLLVFFLVISSLCHSGKSHGGVIRTVIILYMFSTFLAAVIAVIASMMFPITLTLAEGASDLAAPEGIVEVLSSLLLNMVSNPVQSIASANYIGVLVWAVLFGIGLRGASETTKNMFGEISNGLARVVTWIISFAPFGILGLVFNTVSENGLAIFTEYGKLLAVLVGSMLFIYFVTNPILVFWCIRKNPYPLIFKCLKRSAITASSPEAPQPTSRSTWRPARKWAWIRILTPSPSRWVQPSTWTVQPSPSPLWLLPLLTPSALQSISRVPSS